MRAHPSPPAIPPLCQRAEQILKAMEATVKLDLCIKLFRSCTGGESVLGEVQGPFNNHRSGFCKEVKRTRLAQCIACDIHELIALCKRRKKSFVRTCHAGATEIIVPIFEDEALIAIVCLGQFRIRASQSPALPLLDAPTCRRLLSLCGLLEAFLMDGWRTPLFLSETSRGFRREAIDRFLRKNLKNNPSMADLAAHLGLSTARTAHAVKEATGTSFVSLRDELRLQLARGLLQSTYYKVSHIAGECGFASPQYFHRFFREHTGVTPSAYRCLHRPEI